MTHLRIVEDDLRPFLTVKLVADRLKISERTVRQMVTDRRITSYRVEGQRRFLLDDVDAYLAERMDEAA